MSSSGVESRTFKVFLALVGAIFGAVATVIFGDGLRQWLVRPILEARVEKVRLDKLSDEDTPLDGLEYSKIRDLSIVSEQLSQALKSNSVARRHVEVGISVVTRIIEHLDVYAGKQLSNTSQFATMTPLFAHIDTYREAILATLVVCEQYAPQPTEQSQARVLREQNFTGLASFRRSGTSLDTLGDARAVRAQPLVATQAERRQQMEELLAFAGDKLAFAKQSLVDLRKRLEEIKSNSVANEPPATLVVSVLVTNRGGRSAYFSGFGTLTVDDPQFGETAIVLDSSQIDTEVVAAGASEELNFVVNRIRLENHARNSDDPNGKEWTSRIRIFEKLTSVYDAAGYPCTLRLVWNDGKILTVKASVGKPVPSSALDALLTASESR